MRQAVILCGGRGERLRPLTDDRPKALVRVGERPFLDHLLAQLQRSGCEHVVLLSGYRADQIVDHVGNQWGRMNIDHSVGPAEWSTGRRLLEARHLLADNFLLLYSDNYAHLDWTALEVLQHEHDAGIVLSVDRKSPGNVLLDDASSAKYATERGVAGHDYVEVGYMLCAKRDIIVALDRHVGSESALPLALQSLSNLNRVWALEIRGGYVSISSPERRDHAQRTLSPKKILLVDRDGTINVRPPRGMYVTSVDAFTWREDAENAVRELARRGFTFVVVTNQAGIATGDLERQTLQRIHERMALDFELMGAELLGVLCNEEHWSVVSRMRKPGPGMILQAAETWQFHPERVMYVGDDVRDAQTAYNAGCVGVLIGSHVGEQLPPGTLQVASFGDAIDLIERRYEQVRSW